MPDSAHRYATIADWVAHESLPCSLDPAHADQFNAAVDRLVASLGAPGVDILGFGETLHGGEEILLLRNRLFQRLVTNHGFTAIAIESSYPRGRFVTQYITAAGPTTTLDAAMDSGTSHGFGKLEANRELVEWMRRHNADAARRRDPPLHFYGFDQPAVTAGPASPRQSLHFAIDHLAALDAPAAQSFRDRIDPLLGEDAPWENPMIWRDPAAAPKLLAAVDQLRLATEDLLSALSIRGPQSVSATSLDRHLDALHDAKVVRNLLNFFVAMGRSSDFSTGLAVRDAAQFDNVRFILDRERRRIRGAKLLLFAHNMHLKRGLAGWQLGPSLIQWWPAGAHLAAPGGLGPRYAVIGTAVGVSDQNAIPAPPPDSLESHLLVAGSTDAPSAANAPAAGSSPIRFIPTHRGDRLPRPLIDALTPRPGSSRNGTYFPLTRDALTDYDAITVLDHVTYPRGAPPLPPAPGPAPGDGPG